MITRIEIDGFKSFLDFKLDVPPFLALVGPNASGKSNLFDASEFEQESLPGLGPALLKSRRGRPHELFHRVVNLAAVLGRVRGTESFDDLLIDLAFLVPDVVRVAPELDEKRQEWSFDLVFDGQGNVPSTLLSDGTLMIEEIENGLHPNRLAELLRRMRRRVTDFADPNWRPRRGCSPTGRLGRPFAEATSRPCHGCGISRRSPIRNPYSTRSCRKATAAVETITSNTSGRTSISRCWRAYPRMRNGSPGPKRC